MYNLMFIKVWSKLISQWEFHIILIIDDILRNYEWIFVWMFFFDCAMLDWLLYIIVTPQKIPMFDNKAIFLYVLKTEFKYLGVIIAQVPYERGVEFVHYKSIFVEHRYYFCFVTLPCLGCLLTKFIIFFVSFFF